MNGEMTLVARNSHYETVSMTRSAELLDIWAETDQSVVFVTHDIDEAVTLADKIVIMDAEPGTVQSTLSIDFSRPRDRTATAFVDYVAQIRDELGSPTETNC